MMHFNEAKELFSKARNKQAGKPLELNTRLVKLTDTCYGIKLYNTIVVEIHHDGMYRLTTGGWHTQTTKKRINKYSPIRISSVKNQWYINHCKTNIQTDIFIEGLMVYE